MLEKNDKVEVGSGNNSDNEGYQAVKTVVGFRMVMTGKRYQTKCP